MSWVKANAEYGSVYINTEMVAYIIRFSPDQIEAHFAGSEVLDVTEEMAEKIMNRKV